MCHQFAASRTVFTMVRVPPKPMLLLLSLAAAISYVSATIFVPEEIPSLLSVVYSNLPPIKKGTDSKFGVGFRLGPNADVQFQLELGPQKYTQPIGPTKADDSSSKKRHVPATQGKPNDWLNNWRLQMNPGYVDDVHSEGSDNNDLNAPQQSTEMVDSDTVMHLKQLYNMRQARRADTSNT
ncbi:uncharacterized protein LOC126845001 [Adelges cooleyi]|uniref:uncharacterized protein LOC126845001 n=1 Tax=Adelges cooleyi TaxID=133065 RepID=UPI00217F3BF6|nr:uncharacterized protein LOC126845001 [Adelges cooleyi]